MPFTPLHPAAVLPLARGPLIPSALVIGAMAPDLPYYVSLQWIGGDYNLTLTHSTSSLLWLDPLVALVLLAAWHLLLTRPLVALLPEAVAGRVTPDEARLGLRDPVALGWAVVSVTLGAATHLAWDHLGTVLDLGRPGLVDLLGDVVGALVLLAWARHWWRTTTPPPLGPGRTLPVRARVTILVAVLALSAAWTALRAVRYAAEVSADLRSYGEYTRSAVLELLARGAVVDAATALGVTLAAYAVGWHLWRRPGPGARAGDRSAQMPQGS